MCFRDVGHNRSASLFERVRRKPHWNGHHILHHNSKENSVLHGELDFAYRVDFLSLRLGILPASRSWWKSDAGYFHPSLTGCVLIARVQDFTTNISCPPTHRQVPPFHIHNEHLLYFGYRYNHQLELSRATNTSDAPLDTRRLSQIPSCEWICFDIDITPHNNETRHLNVCTFLQIYLCMRRPRKTRLRWMMEMQGAEIPTFGSAERAPPPNPGFHIPPDLPAKHSLEALELADLHHPNCKINRKVCFMFIVHFLVLCKVPIVKLNKRQRKVQFMWYF